METLGLNLPQGEDSLVVAAAVAFINSLETVVTVVDGVEVHAKAGSNTEDSTQAASDGIVAPQPALKQKPRRKRKFKPGYSTEQGRRKKAELLALRSEVAGLEEWLQQLKHIRPSLGDLVPVGHPAISQASMDAMNEFEKRRRSERVNAKLKEILEHQVKVTEELSSAFRKLHPTPVEELSSATIEPCLRVDNTPTLVDQLGEQVARLYLDCDSVFPKTYLPSFGCTMKPAVDQYRGRVMEIVARAPLACPMKRASDILWQELSTVRKYPDKVYRYMTERGPDAVAKGFDMTLRSKVGTTAVNGLQFMKKFEESDRIVQVRAYTLLLPTEGVHLRGHAWTVISQSVADPHNRSDVQFYLQLFVETQDGVYPRKEDIGYIREVGLEAWSLKMRMYTVWLQEMVAEKANTIVVS